MADVTTSRADLLPPRLALRPFSGTTPRNGPGPLRPLGAGRPGAPAVATRPAATRAVDGTAQPAGMGPPEVRATVQPATPAVPSVVPVTAVASGTPALDVSPLAAGAEPDTTPLGIDPFTPPSATAQSLRAVEEARWAADPERDGSHEEEDTEWSRALPANAAGCEAFVVDDDAYAAVDDGLTALEAFEPGIGTIVEEAAPASPTASPAGSEDGASLSEAQLHVLATFEAVARRVRAGEIVPATDPSATHEAVLASVLASLLTART